MTNPFRSSDLRISRRHLIGTAAGLSATAALTAGDAWAAPGFTTRASRTNAQDGSIFRLFYQNFPTLDPKVYTSGCGLRRKDYLKG